MHLNKGVEKVEAANVVDVNFSIGYDKGFLFCAGGSFPTGASDIFKPNKSLIGATCQGNSGGKTFHISYTSLQLHLVVICPLWPHGYGPDAGPLVRTSTDLEDTLYGLTSFGATSAMPVTLGSTPKPPSALALQPL